MAVPMMSVGVVRVSVSQLRVSVGVCVGFAAIPT